MIVKFKNGYQVQIRDCVGKSYKELIEIAKKAVKDAVTLEKRIDTNTSFMPTKMKAAIAAEDQDMFNRELKFLMRDLDADLSRGHKNYPKTYRPEVIEKLLKQYEDAYHLVEKADDKFDTNNSEAIYDRIAMVRQNWGMEPKALFEDARNDIPPYRVKITYEDGEVTIKYVDDLTAAVKDIRGRIATGKKDGNKVAVALVFDSMTDEIVLSSDRDADIRVEDADGDMKDPAVLGYIEYVDLGAKEKKFENADAARIELKKLLEAAKKSGEPVALAAILNADTEDVIEEVYRADAEVKDAPPPYFDPTDYPSIKSDYSVDRLSREARHLEKGSPILSELDDVHSEIDELIAKGSDALIDAGWSKDDARRAIATRYTALEKELRKNNLKDEARELHKKIRALEKAWDLRV